MALRRPCAAARICTAKKVCLTVLATSTVSGVWPLAAKARSSVAELQKQLTTAKKEVEAAEQRAEAAKKEAEAAKKEAEAAKKQAKIRIWVGTALSYLVLIFVAGVVTGIVPRIISSKLPPSVAEVIKQALYR